MRASVAILVFFVVQLAQVGANCTTDEDCSLLGVCTSGKCVCDPGWKGDDCGTFNLAPAVVGSGYNLTGLSPPTSSWGANIFQDESDKKKWHMFVAEFANHCDISAWSPNSKITHSISSTGPLGPYAAKDQAVGTFSHNPKVVRAPDGTWLMYTIGTPIPASRLHNCSHSTDDKVSEGWKSGGGAAAPTPFLTPGRTPGNLESNVTLYTSTSLDGPWTRFGQVLGPNDEGTWDEDTSNPSPWVLSNGTVLLMYRGCVVSGGGCKDEYIGVASAQSWKGPYVRLSKTSILPDTMAEDPSMWVDSRGNYHFLMHYIPDASLVARHAFSRSYLGPWSIHTHSIPYNTTVPFSDGTVVKYHKRERPHIVFDAAGVPTHFVSGVVLGSGAGYNGASFTLIQEVAK